MEQCSRRLGPDPCSLDASAQAILRGLPALSRPALGIDSESMDDAPWSELSPAGAVPISEVTEEEVVRVSPNARLREVVEALVGANIGAVVVGDEAKIMGIISERDIVHALGAGVGLDAVSAMDVAHTNLIWCDVTATVAEVAAEMMEQYVRHVLVEQDGSLVGIVSARDLLGVYAAADVEVE